MPAPRNGDELLGLVRKFVLAHEASLTAFRRQFPRLPASATETAWRLVEAQILMPADAFALMKETPNGFHLGRDQLLNSIQSPGVGDWFMAEHHIYR